MPKCIIRNEDCMETIAHMKMKHIKVDAIITSPPYNTSKKVKPTNAKSIKNLDVRYDAYTEERTSKQYIEWMKGLFIALDDVVVENGVLLFNMSYGGEAATLKRQGRYDTLWLLIATICTETCWTVADKIVWKKQSAMPNNRSKNKLTRICEDIFVFCRKSEYATFCSNKQVLSKTKRGQNNYEVVYNYIEARNNDGPCTLNKATYSSELVTKLLDIYVGDGKLVYDPFGGTGTTMYACIQSKRNISCIMSEISHKQVEYAKERCNYERRPTSPFNVQQV